MHPAAKPSDKINGYSQYGLAFLTRMPVALLAEHGPAMGFGVCPPLGARETDFCATER